MPIAPAAAQHRLADIPRQFFQERVEIASGLRAGIFLQGSPIERFERLQMLFKIELKVGQEGNLEITVERPKEALVTTNIRSIKYNIPLGKR